MRKMFNTRFLITEILQWIRPVRKKNERINHICTQSTAQGKHLVFLVNDHLVRFTTRISVTIIQGEIKNSKIQTKSKKKLNKRVSYRHKKLIFN